MLKPSKGIDEDSSRRSVLDEVARAAFFEKVTF